MAFALLAMDELRYECGSDSTIVDRRKLILFLAMMTLPAASAMSQNPMGSGWQVSKQETDITPKVGSYIPGPTFLRWRVLSVWSIPCC